MWQSHVEIEGYSVLSFNALLCHIAELPLRVGLIRAIYGYLMVYEVHMSPTLNEVQQYATSKTAM